MESREVVVVKRGTIHFRHLFVRWLTERKEFLIPFFVLFVVVDPLITFIGTHGFNFAEGNFIVSTLVNSENGWVIWLGVKIAFGLVGTVFMFLAYYTINTQRLSINERERATIFEYGAWSFLICLLFIIILHWVSLIASAA